MNETDKNCRSMKQIIKDATDRELEKYETKELTPDELKAMVASVRKKKKRRYSRLAGIAALFIIAVFGAAMAFNGLTSDVEADKNAKEEIVTEDGVIIEDGGWGSSTEDNWVITDWDEVAVAKAMITELAVPEYVPEEYRFEQLNIEQIENIINAEYSFFNNSGDSLIINQYIQNEKLDITNIYNDYRCINFDGGVAYVIENETNKEAIIQINDGSIVEIWSNFIDDEIIKIIENIYC